MTTTFTEPRPPASPDEPQPIVSGATPDSAQPLPESVVTLRDVSFYYGQFRAVKEV